MWDSPMHLLIIAIVVLVLFGGKKLPELGKGLGEGLRGFKEGVKGIGECGVYTYEVAETKVTQVMDFARKHQHPLQCVMEKK